MADNTAELAELTERYYKFLQHVALREGNLSVREEAKFKLRLIEILNNYPNRTEFPPLQHHP